MAPTTRHTVMAQSGRRQRGGYLALFLLVGLVGGTAIAALAAGRRTASAFPQFLASTNPSDVNATAYPGQGTGTIPYSPALASDVTQLPGVRAAGSVDG